MAKTRSHKGVSSYASLAGKARIGLQWVLSRKGPLAVGINQGGLFTRVSPTLDSPDVQFHFATLSADLAGGDPHPWSGCTFSVCQLRPESRGSVTIRSMDPFEAPVLRANYLATETDQHCTVEGIKFARRLAATAALRPLLAEEYRPSAAVQTDDQLLEFARESGQTIFHPSGTCKMGTDPMAVTDARLRVHGVCGLHRRLFDHADAGLGEHQRARRHDRREGIRYDLGRRTDGSGLNAISPDVPPRAAAGWSSIKSVRSSHQRQFSHEPREQIVANPSPAAEAQSPPSGSVAAFKCRAPIRSHHSRGRTR